MVQSIYRRHKVFLFGGFVVVLLFFFLVPVNFACCWDPGELSPAAGVNTYHIMHSPCNTIPLSLSVTSGRKTTNYVAGSSRDWGWCVCIFTPIHMNAYGNLCRLS